MSFIHTEFISNYLSYTDTHTHTHVKNMPVNVGDIRLGLDPWVGKIPWRRAWQPSLVFLSGEFHGQRSLVGYGPWGCKESDTTERPTHTQYIVQGNTAQTPPSWSILPSP